MAILAGSTAIASPKYTILDLGTLPGTSSSVATSINDRGQVVGISYNREAVAGGAIPIQASPSEDARSFLYQDGRIGQVDALGGLARGINNLGQIVGGPNKSINDSGRYVGEGTEGVHVFPGSSSTGSASDGRSTPGSFTGRAINNNGVVVGDQWIRVNNGLSSVDTTFPTVLRDGVTSHPVYDPNDRRANLIQGRIVAINDRNDALITAVDLTTNKTTVQILNLDGKGGVGLSNLPGWQGTSAAALNNKGEVVGSGFLYEGSTLHRLVDLIPLSGGWSSLNALDINDEGLIVGQGMIDGQLRGFLMTPEGAANVPEPATLAVWSLIVAAGVLRCLPSRAR